MELKYVVAMVGIAGITILDAIALLCGIDGTAMLSSATIIGAIVGGIFGFKISQKAQ